MQQDLLGRSDGSLIDATGNEESPPRLSGREREIDPLASTSIHWPVQIKPTSPLSFSFSAQRGQWSWPGTPIDTHTDNQGARCQSEYKFQELNW